MEPGEVSTHKQLPYQCGKSNVVNKTCNLEKYTEDKKRDRENPESREEKLTQLVADI